MTLLKTVWRGFTKVAEMFGNVMSAILLTIFYYTVFALFALPHRLLNRHTVFSKKSSNWVKRSPKLFQMSDVQNE